MIFLKPLTTIVFILTLIQCSFAQKDPIKFGKISDEQFNLKSYEKDTSANALVLYDFGESSYQYNSIEGFQYKFNTIKRVKILKKEGYASANFEIVIRKKYENLTSIKGITINVEDGKPVKVKLEGDQIFREDYNKYFEIIKFEMPAVKEGSIIDVEYSITSDLIQYIRDWYFQSEIPTLYSEYRVSIPEYFYFKQLEKGYFSIGERTQISQNVKQTGTEKTRSEIGVASTKFEQFSFNYNETKYTFKSENIPAFYVEDYITSKENYLSSIQFELGSVRWPNKPIKNYTTTWEAINQELLTDSDFGSQIHGVGFLKDELNLIETLNKTPEAKIDATYKLIQNHMNWNGRYSFYSFEQNKAWRDGNGTIGDINLILVAALKRLGLDANPVILSTRNHGAIHPAQIILDQFNYVIAAVQLEDKTILLDATDKYTPSGILPERCLNGQGRLINKTEGKWIDLNPITQKKQAYVVTVNMNDANEFEGYAKEKHEGYAAIDKRKEMNYFTNDEDYLDELQKKHTAFSFTLDSISNKNELVEPLNIYYGFESEDYIEKSGNLLLVNPIFLGQIGKNPFKLENREYPVDYSFLYSTIYMISITIPDGYTIENLPKSKNIALPERAASYTLSAQSMGNTITLVSKFNLNKVTFLPTDYLYLKEFYNQVINAQSQQIILKKI